MRLRCAFLVLWLAALATSAHAVDYRLLVLDGMRLKWGGPHMGVGAVVTYGFVDKNQSFDDAINCKSMAPIPDVLEPSGITQRTIEREFHAAFQMWNAVANISFNFVEDPSQADILVGVQGKPRNIAFANVWYDDSDGTQTIGSLTRSAICLNPTVDWEVNFDGNVKTYSVRQVAAHEIGHAIGLDHPGRTGQLMGYRYSEARRGLHYGDVLGAVKLYGANPNH